MRKISSVALTTRVFFVFLSVLLFSVLIIGSAFYVYYKGSIEGMLKETIGLSMKSNAENINEFFVRAGMATTLMNSDQSELVPLLSEYDGDLFQGVKDYRAAKLTLSGYMDITVGEISPYVAYLFVNEERNIFDILPEGHMSTIKNVKGNDKVVVLQKDSIITDEDWYLKAEKLNGKPYWFKFEKNSSELFLAKSFKQDRLENRKVKKYNVGAILCGFDMSWIIERLNKSELTKDARILLVSENGEIIYSNTPEYEGLTVGEFLGTGVVDNNNVSEVQVGGTNHYIQVESLDQGLSLITLVPHFDVSKRIREMLSIVFFIIIGVAITGAVITAFLSHIVILPIKKLSLHMLNNSDLQLIDTDSVKSNEAGILYSSFNNMMKKIQTLIEEVRISANRQKEAELKTLQAQINPHFLYNTLDSICCIALVNHEYKIAEGLSALADLLRYNIKNPDIVVPLEQELDIIENYISIQRLKNGERLTYCCDIDESMKDVFIPKMLIQPLIENSITHGASLETGNIEIDLLCFEERENIIILVQDKGNNADVNRINRHLSGEINISTSAGGFGIRNVQQRIQINYGNQYGLWYEKNDYNGTNAIISIPKVAIRSKDNG